MNRKSPIINFLLILILFLLLGWGAYTWYHPKFPASVEGDEIAPASRELQAPTLSRKVYSNAMVKDVASLNLFRKQRKKYYQPKPPKPKPQPKARIKPAPPKVTEVRPPPPAPRPTAPPPQLVLTGVMLLGDQKVAIFEGTYSEIQGKQLIENLKPRRRGYKIGESLGGYKIETIHKTHATLSAIASNNITLTISKTPASNKIEKTGNRLIQKSKAASNKTAETTSSTRSSRASRSSRARRASIQKKGLNAETTPSSRASRASRARRIQHLNRVRTKESSPSTKQPPAITTPVAESPDPSNPRRPQ